MISSNDESNEALAAPLLRSEVDEFGDHIASGLARMERDVPAGSDSNNMMLSSGPMSHPGVRRAVFWLLGLRTAADALPSLLELVVTSGKMSVVVFAGLYLVFVCAWLPFWLLSFVISEWGVYFLATSIVFLVGRSIIRLIAFPGSSHKVSSEIETEFAKYSVRMLISSSNSLIELASAILSTKGGSQSAAGDEIPKTSNPNLAYYEIPGLWKRAKSYRDRVIGVYAEVLAFILKGRDATTGENSTTGFTKYGNNRLSGDVGDLTGLTVCRRAEIAIPIVVCFNSNKIF